MSFIAALRGVRSLERGFGVRDADVAAVPVMGEVSLAVVGVAGDCESGDTAAAVEGVAAKSLLLGVCASLPRAAEDCGERFLLGTSRVASFGGRVSWTLGDGDCNGRAIEPFDTETFCGRDCGGLSG